MPDFKYNQVEEDLDTELEGIMESQTTAPAEDAPETAEPEPEGDSGLARIARGDLPSVDVEQTVAQMTPPVEQVLLEQGVRGMLKKHRDQSMEGRATVHNFLQGTR